ncbi:MAG: glycine betaine ABC transporter substrate-binding protein [Actinomycetes bacterium]
MNRRVRSTGLVAAFAALALVAAACGGAKTGSASTAAGATGSGSSQPVTLAINSWTGSESDVALACYLLTSQLKVGCKGVQIDEIPTWPAMASGKVDGVLEVWGHPNLYRTYVTDKHEVVDGGPLGAVGHIGWYVPTWLMQKYPQLSTWTGLKSLWKIFVTPESSPQGQFLDGSPSYVTNDAAVIKNLGLNFKVVYAGSEAAEITQIRQSVALKKPLIFYWYTPQWLNSELSLSEVKLPAYTPACGALAAGKINCAYPTYNLYKAFNAKFAAANSPAYQLLRNMKLTNTQQDQISDLIAAKKMSPQAAAAAWAAANSAVWKAWIPAGS